MTNALEEIYTTRHLFKNKAGGGSSGFEKERIELFTKWVGGGKKVLDIGCRDGRIARHIINLGNTVTGFDVDAESLKLCPEGMKTEWHDLNEDWQKGYDGVFDVVLATEVIEHIYYPDRTLSRITHVLNPNGMFIGSVPNAFNIKNRIRLFFAQIQNTPLAEPTHINHFSRQSLEVLLKKHFKEVYITGVARSRWSFLARLFPGLCGSLLVFRVRFTIK